VGASAGRLGWRPPAPVLGHGLVAGTDERLGLSVVRDGVLYIPDTASAGAPVMLFLHGAGGTGRRELRAVVAAADRVGAVIVAPDSRGVSWDIFETGFGPDVEFIDRVLTSVGGRCEVDFGRLAVGGISDGATYALSLGLSNGDIFGSIIAFSPGGVAVQELVGKPRLFFSHGTQDPILPIDSCSRVLVPNLREGGYDVTYREFDGGHTVPPVIADEALRWWVQ